MLLEKHNRIILLLILLISVFLWVFYLYYYSSTLIEAGGMEYAQIANNLYKGNGFKTDIILPFRLNYPSYDYPFKYGLLQPLVTSLFFKIFGVQDFSVVFSSAIFYFFIILILFIFAKEIFSIDVAIISILLFAFNPVVLTWVMWGNPDPLFTFLLLLSLLILVKNKSPVLAGFIFSICLITRLHFYFYLPGIMLFIYFIYQKQRLLSILRFIVGMLPVSSIFLLYQYLNAGILVPSFAGNYLALFTPTYPGPQSLRTTEVIPFFKFLISHPGDIIAKVRIAIYNFVNFFPLIINPYLMSFFIGGIFFGYQRSKSDKYKLLIIFFIFSTIFFYLVSIGYIERYILTLLPFLILIASHFIIILFNTFVISLNILIRKIFFLIFLSFLIIPYLFFDVYTLALNRKGIEQKKELHNAISVISQNNFKKDDFVLSDSPWPVAWYGKRKCIWLPIYPDDIGKIEKKIKIKGIILTSSYIPESELDTPSLWLTKFTEPKGESHWTEIFEGRKSIKGFKRRVVKLKEFFVVYFIKDEKK